MGPIRWPWTGHRRWHSPPQVAGRSGPYPLGQLHADIDAARTRACGSGPAGRLSGPVGHGEALLCGGNTPTLIRAPRHASIFVWHHLQYLQGRRAVEDRIDATYGGCVVPAARWGRRNVIATPNSVSAAPA